MLYYLFYLNQPEKAFQYNDTTVNECKYVFSIITLPTPKFKTITHQRNYQLSPPGKS